MGSFSKNTDLRCSKTSYISGDKAEDVGKTQYVAALSTLAPAVTVAKPVETPVKETAYKLAYYQAMVGKYFYFNGETAGYNLAMTDNAAMAVDVYMEEVTGGVRFYILKGEEKNYIDIYKSGSYVNIGLKTEPTAVFTYDADLKTYVADIEGTKYYMGSFSKNTDLRCSKTSYISGDKAEDVGKTQYVAALSTIEFVEE